MSQLSYYEVRLNRPNKQYHINYNSAQSSIQLDLESKLKYFSSGMWKSIKDTKTVAIQLTGSNDSVSDNVGEITEEGFELDLKKMETNKKYSVSYDDSIYQVYKNEKNELVISEIG